MTLLERDERMWEQGHQEGVKEGENLFASLVSKLIKDGRHEDIDRAANDENFRNALFAEYHLK